MSDLITAFKAALATRHLRPFVSMHATSTLRSSYN